MDISEIARLDFIDLFNWIFRFALSFIAGSVLGLERKVRRQVVGMRTLILICESCTLLSMLSVKIASLGIGNLGDPTRIVSTVCSGIGFLGAGAILRQGLNIRGLTSAAIIWTAAAIGLSIGAGFYIPAFIVLFISVFSLIKLERIEQKFFPAGRLRLLTITYKDSQLDLDGIEEIVKKSGLIPGDLGIKKCSEQITVTLSVKSPEKFDLMELNKNLESCGNMVCFEFV